MILNSEEEVNELNQFYAKTATTEYMLDSIAALYVSLFNTEVVRVFYKQDKVNPNLVIRTQRPRRWVPASQLGTGLPPVEGSHEPGGPEHFPSALSADHQHPL